MKKMMKCLDTDLFEVAMIGLMAVTFLIMFTHH